MVLHRKLGVSAPIMDGIYRVIHEGADARNIVSEVMCRPLTAEVDPLHSAGRSTACLRGLLLWPCVPLYAYRSRLSSGVLSLNSEV